MLFQNGADAEQLEYFKVELTRSNWNWFEFFCMFNTIFHIFKRKFSYKNWKLKRGVLDMPAESKHNKNYSSLVCCKTETFWCLTTTYSHKDTHVDNKSWSVTNSSVSSGTFSSLFQPMAIKVDVRSLQTFNTSEVHSARHAKAINPIKSTGARCEFAMGL